MQKNYVAKQVRIPMEMSRYIQEEAKRAGISQNSFIVVLLEQGKKIWEMDSSIIKSAIDS